MTHLRKNAAGIYRTERRQDLKGGGLSHFKVLSWYLPGETVKPRKFSVRITGNPVEIRVGTSRIEIWSVTAHETARQTHQLCFSEKKYLPVVISDSTLLHTISDRFPLLLNYVFHLQN